VRPAYIALLLVVLASIGCAQSTAPTSTTSTTSTTSSITPSTFTITWNSVAFPATAIGTTSSATFVATLWNVGTSTAAIGSVTDSNVGEFPWSTTCSLGGVLAAGSSCTVTAQFKPSALGVQTGTLDINANAKDQTLSLTGTGVPAVNPQLSIAPSIGSVTTPFVLTLSGATPGGQLSLHTTYTPAPGNADVPFATTLWTADPSGQLSVTSSHDSPGSFEIWFVDTATGLSSNHVVSVVE
jgi:hypothetical protein